ncbi:hypothetical protein [Rahnella sp. PD4]|uniref:hypothetical protein n=1 Tax=Rahnella sp. PD4 TaxID=3368611 RepID=UPI003B9F786A
MKEQIAKVAENGWLEIYNGHLPEDWYAGFEYWSTDVDTEHRASALKNIAYCLLNGKGTKADVDKAKETYILAHNAGVESAILEYYHQLVRMDYSHILVQEIQNTDQVKADFPAFKEIVGEMQAYSSSGLEDFLKVMKRVVWMRELFYLISLSHKTPNNIQKILEDITPIDDEECRDAMRKILALHAVKYYKYHSSEKRITSSNTVAHIGNVGVTSGYSTYKLLTYKFRVINDSDYDLQCIKFKITKHSDKIYESRKGRYIGENGDEISYGKHLKFTLGMRHKSSLKSHGELHTFINEKYPFINLKFLLNISVKGYRELTLKERLFGYK